MEKKRRSLYERLPEIYRERDSEQQLGSQLKQYLELFDAIIGEIQENIESLYHDLFIVTFTGWAIPYISDLLVCSYESDLLKRNGKKEIERLKFKEETREKYEEELEEKLEVKRKKLEEEIRKVLETKLEEKLESEHEKIEKKIRELIKSK